MSGARIFLTGVTGFVGKVVLETLIRRREELGVASIAVLIRPKRDKRSGETRPARERFEQEVAGSRCFSKLPANWLDCVEVVAGDLTSEHLGIDHDDRLALQSQLTHIINCAASVEFNLPLAEAAASNITSALNVLELARGCSMLRQFVNVSTAYVTPHPGEGVPVREELVSLPFDPEAVYQSILAGTADEITLMAETGHPNTYTFTKCLSEHMLTRKRGEVPLAIVRPSIISASWEYPHIGWIDSYAAFAGFVSLIGAGLLKCVYALENTILDVVPCDEVARRVVDTAFLTSPPLIQHCTTGLDKGCRNDTSINGIESYFQRNPVRGWASMRKVSNGGSIRLTHLLHHTLPMRIAQTASRLRGDTRGADRIGKLLDKIEYLHEAFPYFTHHSFDFQASTPITIHGFEPKQYIERICRGVAEHMMASKFHETPLAGAKHKHPKPDLRWTRQQPQGNWAIRTAAYVVRKGLRRCTEAITFDRGSFEHALNQTEPGSLLVVIPNHRSYMDFLLASYLFFAHPDLRVPIPQIAAASDFARLPFLGWFFQQTYAFYIRRGTKQADPELTRKIQALVNQSQTLEFFIEGTRSRARQFLKPRRGLLRALQGTGIPITILPLAISYDLVPEERSFLRELKAEGSAGMRIGSLLRWGGRLLTGQVRLGRVHLACGAPVRLDARADVYTVSHEVMAQLQAKTTVSSFHLHAFLSRNPQLGLDRDSLEQAILARGGNVIESPLKDVAGLDPITEMTLRYQWLHHFYPDLLALAPAHPVLTRHVSENGYAHGSRLAAEASPEPALLPLLEALFAPLCQEYQRLIAQAAREGGLPDAKSLVRNAPGSFMPYVEEALAGLVEQGLLQASDKGYAQGPNWAKHEAFATACAWPGSRKPSATGRLEACA